LRNKQTVKQSNCQTMQTKLNDDSSIIGEIKTKAKAFQSVLNLAQDRSTNSLLEVPQR
jgi:hypothetical protein